MTPPPDEHNLAERLTAFADGELDAAQTLAMWTYLSEHPERHAALEWLRDQQQLTLAARRVADRPAPAELKNRIASLLDAKPEPLRLNAPPPSSHRRIGFAFAVAASLLLGASAALFFTRASAQAEVIPGRLIATVGRVHAECSRLPEALHDASFEGTNAKLAATVKASLGTTSATPDLSPAGFRLVGAGPCLGIDVQTVHLLYRSTSKSSKEVVSVFVQADTGKFAHLEAGRVYRVSSPTSPFPMLAWKTSGIIYFLLADDDKTEAAVLQTMRPTPPEEILTVASR